MANATKVAVGMQSDDEFNLLLLDDSNKVVGEVTLNVKAAETLRDLIDNTLKKGPVIISSLEDLERMKEQ